MVDPAAAVRKFERLTEAGGRAITDFMRRSITRVPDCRKGRRSRSCVHTWPITRECRWLRWPTRSRGAMRTRFHASLREGYRAAAAGADAARSAGGEAARGRSFRGVKVRELVPPVVRRFDTPHDAVPRTQLLSNGALFGDADLGRIGLQPLAGYFDHALARGCHARLLGHVHLPARRAIGLRLVGGLPAERRRAGLL